MSIENMKRISDAETEAASLRRDAAYKAKLILDEGRKQAESLTEEARRESDKNYRAAIAFAGQQADQAYEARMTEVAAECAALKQRARARLPEAVRLITGKVVGNSGNR